MVIPTGLDNNARCHILDPLQLIKQFIRNTIQKAIPIIKSIYYEGVNQESSHMLRPASYCHSGEADYDSAMLLDLSHMPGFNAVFSSVGSFILNETYSWESSANVWKSSR